MRPLRLLLVPLALALACVLPAAHASSSSGLVISQVYAGGGNSGATYQNDYVVILNRSSSSVDLSSWTLQYASASSTSWQVTPLTGTIAAGRSYLVQLASTAAVGSTLPTPDATDTTNLANTGGKLAIVHDTAALSCGTTAGSCFAVAAVGDLVGYGTATDYEGTGAAPALSATTADFRAAAGCTDSDANSADFATGDPAPLNSASPATTCAGSGGSTGSGSASASVAVDLPSSVSVSLNHASLAFGTAAVGSTPSPLPESVTVTSSDTAGYVLTAHRSAFAPGDLPLGLGATAPSGATLGTGLGGSTLLPLPIAPAADLVVGSKAAVAASAGDVWPAQVGFTSALPALSAGHYTATVTFTVIGR
jgi:predicted extracellular nuclease